MIVRGKEEKEIWRNGERARRGKERIKDEGGEKMLKKC